MTDKQLAIKRRELDVRVAQSRVREAKICLDEGERMLRAEYEQEYEKLKAEFDRACIELEREQAALEHALGATNYEENEE